MKFGQIGIINYGSGIDTDVLNYKTRVETAGGSLQNNDDIILDTFVKTLKNNLIWDKLYDIGVFMGGFDGCFVKLKYADSLYKECSNSGFTSLNYSESSGITSSDTTKKKINTQIIPSDYGLNNLNFSCGIKIIPNNTSLDIWMQDDPASGNPNFYMRHDTTVINGTPTRECLSPWTDLNTPRFQFMSLTSTGVLWGTDYQSKYPFPPAVSVSSISLTNPISVLGGTVGGVQQNSRGTIQFYWIGEYLDWDEIKILENAVDTLLISKGRITNPPVLLCFGDSITRGISASPFTNRYTSLLATDFNLMQRNMGNHSSAMTADSSQAWGGYNRRLDLLNYNLIGSKVIIQYGVNDCISLDNTANGDSSLITTFTSNIVTICNELISEGVSIADIQIGSISIINTASAPLLRQQAWIEGARQAAIQTGVKYVDVWQYMTDNGGVATLLTGDGIHPNNSGHSAMEYAHYNLAGFVS